MEYYTNANYVHTYMQLNLSMKYTLKKGHFSVTHTHTPPIHLTHIRMHARRAAGPSAVPRTCSPQVALTLLHPAVLPLPFVQAGKSSSITKLPRECTNHTKSSTYREEATTGRQTTSPSPNHFPYYPPLPSPLLPSPPLLSPPSHRQSLQ